MFIIRILISTTGLLDAPAEGRFDRITRIAKRLFNTPMAMVTLVDKDRQWFKSAMGLVGVSETPRSQSFCSQALDEDEVLEIEDASQDPRFVDNPLVTGEPFIRFYAGRAVYFDGQPVGALCVIDRVPRSLDASQRQDLIDLALWVESEIDSDNQSQTQTDLMSEVDRLREMALVDGLTRTWNRTGIGEVFNRELSLAEREKDSIAVIVADIDHFKSINDTYGHDVGDIVLKRVADRIRLSIRPYDAIGRMGGEEFLVILPKTHVKTAMVVANRLRTSVEEVPIELPDGKALPVTLSLGVAAGRCRPGFRPEQDKLVKAADEALYRAKQAGRNRVEASPELKP